MSPEDDLQTERIPAIDDIPINRAWKPILQTDTSVKLNGRSNSPSSQLNIKTNGTNCTTSDNPTWSSPLLKDSTVLAVSDEISHKSNNNEWSQMTPSIKRDGKNGWKELPQDEDIGGQQKVNGNGLLNGKNGVNGTNGHDKSAELDPLTGGRKPNDLDELSNCGIGSCQPKWARIFSSTHVFMVVFLMAWILQGMYYTYFVSVITTIEKLFQIKSKTTGLLMSATEIGQIVTALFLTYYAGRGHRPRWIACGMVLFAISAFGCTLPHFIFGNQLLHANNAFYGPVTGQGTASAMQSFIHNSTTNTTDSHVNLCNLNSNTSMGGAECQEDLLAEQAAHTQITSAVLVIFFVSLLGVGVGQTAVSTLGIPYIDDNVASRESPIYIAITIGVRILGPAFGFILGSFCTRIYVDITDPGFGTSDPKWIGAWYLGLVMISSLMILTAMAMFTFPKNLKGNRIPPPIKMREIEAQKKLEKQDEESKPKLKDFPKTIKRQLSNDILMFRTASSVLHLLPVAGLYTFLPKYLESQFRLPAHDANLISGIGGILVMGIGIVISGVVILKFSPTARSVAAWIAFTAVVYSAGMAILMFVGCSMDDFAGLNNGLSVSSSIIPKFEPMCNTTCQCDSNKFSPVCGADGVIYFSSCHAGCSKSIIDNGKTLFSDCACIDNHESSVPDAVSGYCDGNCKSFLLFISLFSFFVFMHSTSEVGSMLLIMRCTDPKDKAMAMGIIQFAIGLFGNVPCPIIYGVVIDSTCLVWETICGKAGACSLYDIDDFRHFFLGTTSGIMLLAFVMDLVVWHKAHRIDFDPDSNVSENELEKPITIIVPPESSM